jgi:putative peptidoglycan lipid II flippase
VEIRNEDVTENTANHQIARGAAVVMAAFVLSNLVGLVRQILITRAFGTSAEIDAFYAAEKLPNILFTLVAGGALASAFIPNFTAFLENEDRKGAWHLASAILNLVTFGLTLISLLAAFFAQWLVATILAPKFPIEQQVLTASLLQILLFTTVLFGASGLIMGILNAHQKFLLPALAPSMYWLGMILGVIFLVPLWGIHGLAWGAVLGAGLHLVVQLPGLLRTPERRYVPTLGLKSPTVRKVGRLMGPRLLGVAVVQINFVVNVIVASGLPDGSLTAITIAFMVMTMPQVVIAQSIAIAALPTFSAQIARGDLSEMRRSLGVTLRGIIFLALPATLGLILLRFPITAFLFERGEFTAASTELVAWALLWYTLGLVGHSLVEIISRAFYALHDTKTPVLVGAGAMALNVFLSFSLPSWFITLGWLPHGGLALANTIATTLEMVILLVLIRNRLGGLQGRRIMVGSAQAGLATLVLSLGVIFWLVVSAGNTAWVIAIGGIVIGGGIYALMMFLFKVPEVKELLGYVVRRLASLSGR